MTLKESLQYHLRLPHHVIDYLDMYISNKQAIVFSDQIKKYMCKTCKESFAHKRPPYCYNCLQYHIKNGMTQYIMLRYPQSTNIIFQHNYAQVRYRCKKCGVYNVKLVREAITCQCSK